MDLSSLTSIPEGFNPTVGGYLGLRSGSKYIGSNVDTNIFWDNGHALIDDIFCKIISERNIDNNKILHAKYIGRDETFYIAKQDNFYAHGKDLHKAIEDLKFKIISEKLKNEPINKDTIIDIKYYRLITGACEFGVKQWIESNNISKESYRADELLPILEKTNAYGVDKFKSLITF